MGFETIFIVAYISIGTLYCVCVCVGLVAWSRLLWNLIGREGLPRATTPW